MKFQIFLWTILILCIFGCSSCQYTKTDHEDNLDKKKYISFTVTKKEQDELNMYVYIYDIDSDTVIQKEKLMYNSQYPLAVYSYYDDSVYYSNRDDEGCDQLYRKSLKSGKNECITNSLFAINYIIPVNEKLFVAAVEKGTRAVGLFEYKDGELTRILNDKDAFVWKICVNPDTNIIVFNTYSQNELDKNMESNEATTGIGENTVWKFNTKNMELISVAETSPGYMLTIGVDSSNIIYYNLDGFRKLENNIDKVDNTFTGLNLKEFIYLNHEYVYYLDYNGALVKYNYTTKEKTTIFYNENDSSVVNNAIALFLTSSLSDNNSENAL